MITPLSQTPEGKKFLQASNFLREIIDRNQRSGASVADWDFDEVHRAINRFSNCDLREETTLTGYVAAASETYRALFHVSQDYAYNDFYLYGTIAEVTARSRLFFHDDIYHGAGGHGGLSGYRNAPNTQAHYRQLATTEAIDWQECCGLYDFLFAGSAGDVFATFASYDLQPRSLARRPSVVRFSKAFGSLFGNWGTQAIVDEVTRRYPEYLALNNQ